MNLRRHLHELPVVHVDKVGQLQCVGSDIVAEGGGNILLHRVNGLDGRAAD